MTRAWVTPHDEYYAGTSLRRRRDPTGYEYSDWIKPVVYHDVAGPRMKRFAIERMRHTILRGSQPETVLRVLYDMMGYDAAQEPEYADLATRGFSADYVYRETRRCVDAVDGRIPVYAGVGFDIPNTDGTRFRSDPERIYQAYDRRRLFSAASVGATREAAHTDPRRGESYLTTAPLRATACPDRSTSPAPGSWRFP